MKGCIITLLMLLAAACGRVEIEYVDRFEPANHPQVGYWFWTPDLLEEEKYLTEFRRMCDQMPFDLVFLSARLGCDFHDTVRFHEPFRRLVDEAHARGVKIGIQLWDQQGDYPDSLCQQVVTQAEGLIPQSGCVRLSTSSELIRAMNIGDVGGRRVVGSRLLRAYAMRMTDAGSFEPGSLVDITGRCRVAGVRAGRLDVEIRAGAQMAGMTAVVLASHAYNVPDMFAHAPQTMRRTLEAYGDIAFDGMALDEFSYMRIVHPANMNGRLWRDRFYSPAMADAYRAKYGRDLVEDLIYARYAPSGADSLRPASINRYMKLMRQGPLAVEQAFYNDSKRLFGEDCFIGFHNTFHNTLEDDELWATGANWWTVPRDYGHTDEHSSLPVQLGIALANASHRALYNMFYDPSVEVVYRKAAEDLRYGIRTLYHAMNDKQAWGASLDNPEVMRQIGRIESGATMLNRFDAPMPRIDVLMVFGVGALSNWYPDASARGVYEVNEGLDIEQKAVALCQAGYMTALVPDELIENGSLTVTSDGKAVLGGREFEAVVFLYPQYAAGGTLDFLEAFVARGGRLMVEGAGDRTFDGGDVAARVEAIGRRAVCDRFSVEGIARLGVTPSGIAGGCRADDGSMVFADYESLQTGHPAEFRFEQAGDTYSGSYCGLVALQAEDGRLVKLAASGLLRLERNGEPILEFAAPVTVELIRNGPGGVLRIKDPDKSIIPVVNRL